MVSRLAVKAMYAGASKITIWLQYVVANEALESKPKCCTPKSLFAWFILPEQETLLRVWGHF